MLVESSSCHMCFWPTIYKSEVFYLWIRTQGDLGLIPGLGSSPGKGNSYTLQYCCLENSMDRGALGGLQSMGSQIQMRLGDFPFTSLHHAHTTWDTLCTRIYNCPEVNLERFVGPLWVYWTQFQCVEWVSSLTNSFCDTNWVSNNSNHSGTTYLEAASDSIDQGLAPPTGFRCWLKVQVVTCVSDLLSINQKFPWWHFWVWFIC